MRGTLDRGAEVGPPYDAGKRATMVFDDVSAVAEDPIGAERAVMFEALYPS